MAATTPPKGPAPTLDVQQILAGAEVHWYEAAGIGRKEYKIKHLL
jgi:hypothetical protein